MNDAIFEQLLVIIENLEMENLENLIKLGELREQNLSLSRAMECLQLRLEQAREKESTHDL